MIPQTTPTPNDTIRLRERPGGDFFLKVFHRLGAPRLLGMFGHLLELLDLGLDFVFHLAGVLAAKLRARC